MLHNPSHAPVCAVVGVGPGNGAAFVRRFAREGCALAMLARSKSVIEGLATELPLARAYLADVAVASEVAESFKQIVSDQGPVDVLIYNAGKGVWGSAVCSRASPRPLMASPGLTNSHGTSLLLGVKRTQC